MTREEALKKVEGCLIDYFPLHCYEEVEEIMKALKQEPNEDCISREHALEPYKILEDTDTLSVYTIRQNLAELPSVTPTRPTGHWIAQDIHNCHTNFRCSECDYVHDFMHLYGEPTADYTFCPNCGAEMKEGDA